jgi:hypothetical protein
MFHFMKHCNVLKPKRNYMYHQAEHSEILYSAHNVFTCYFYGFQNKQRLFLYTPLTEAECLLRGTDWVFKCDRSSFVL